MDIDTYYINLIINNDKVTFKLCISRELGTNPRGKSTVLSTWNST